MNQSEIREAGNYECYGIRNLLQDLDLHSCGRSWEVKVQKRPKRSHEPAPVCVRSQACPGC